MLLRLLLNVTALKTLFCLKGQKHLSHVYCRTLPCWQGLNPGWVSTDPHQHPARSKTSGKDSLVWRCISSGTAGYTVQCSALMQCALQCSALVQCAVQCNCTMCSLVQLYSVQFSALHLYSVQCSTVHLYSLRCSAVQYSTVQYSEVQYSAVHPETASYQIWNQGCKVYCRAVRNRAGHCIIYQ